MTPSEIWPMLVAAGAVVFGAGGLVEKIRNNKYVARELCHQIHKNADERWTRLEVGVNEIRGDVKSLLGENHD